MNQKTDNRGDTISEKIIILTVAILVILGITAYVLWSRGLHRYVRKNSVLIHNVEHINSRYSFHFIDTEYVYYRTCSSKRQFDNFNHDSFAMQCISGDATLFEDRISKVNHNIRELSRYNDELNGSILHGKIDYDTVSRGYIFMNEDRFRRIEASIVDMIRIKPCTGFTVLIKWTYTSPKGRNSYRASYRYGMADVQRLMVQNVKKSIYMTSAEYERSLMTDSLRYDIMKRDGFRCVICGASASDGVQLHIDHILPVSKGGRTERSNLRTLCSRCNLGKRDKYDPFGKN